MDLRNAPGLESALSLLGQHTKEAFPKDFFPSIELEYWESKKTKNNGINFIRFFDYILISTVINSEVIVDEGVFTIYSIHNNKYGASYSSKLLGLRGTFIPYDTEKEILKLPNNTKSL